jgi:hypothetical protein
MSVDPQYIIVGMDVVGTDGELAGTVKAVGVSDIHVDRPFARDVLVPLDAIQAVVSGSGREGSPRVVLGIRGGRVGDMGWPQPE